MTTQPAGEHHTGSLNLTGEGNKPASPISDQMVLDAANAVHAFRGTGHAAIRDALEAAYPAIRQQVAEQIAAALDARSNAHAQIAADETKPGQDDRIKHVSMTSGFQSAAIIARQIGGAE